MRQHDQRPDTASQPAYRALHAVTKRVHASLDLGATLDAVALGVVEGTDFSVAAVNLRLPSGDFEVVSVAGSDDASAALLGTVESAQAWTELLTEYGLDKLLLYEPGSQ